MVKLTTLFTSIYFLVVISLGFLYHPNNFESNTITSYISSAEGSIESNKEAHYFLPRFTLVQYNCTASVFAYCCCHCVGDAPCSMTCYEAPGNFFACHFGGGFECSPSSLGLCVVNPGQECMGESCCRPCWGP